MPTTPTPDQSAPKLKLPLVGGGEFDLATQSPETFTQIVFYRGYHCPICKAQANELQEMNEEFSSRGVQTVLVSMDSEDRAQKSKDEWGVDLPIAYGLSEDDAKAWGLYLSEAFQESEPRIFSEPGMFWVRPDGTIYMASVSNTPFIRPDLKPLPGRIDFVKDKGYPARGTHA